MKWALLLAILGTWSGCFCTEESRPGIVVTLIDSTTGEPIIGLDGTVVAIDDAHADTARFPIANGFGLAYQRAGTYRVEATATGYATWVRDPVRVRGFAAMFGQSSWSLGCSGSALRDCDPPGERLLE